MARAPRTDLAGQIYHVMNRANDRTTIFKKKYDFIAFESLLEEAILRRPVELFSYEVMPNHWHFCLRTFKDGDLANLFGWMSLTHAQRWRNHYGTVGSGHLYKGRYKSILVQDNDYFLTLVRYIESNARRARLALKAEDWRWSSLWRRLYGTEQQKKILSSWPVDMPDDYLKFVNTPMTSQEIDDLSLATKRGRPYGDYDWQIKKAKEFGLESTFRPRGKFPKRFQDPFREK